MCFIQRVMKWPLTSMIRLEPRAGLKCWWYRPRGLINCSVMKLLRYLVTSDFSKWHPRTFTIQVWNTPVSHIFSCLLWPKFNCRFRSLCSTPFLSQTILLQWKNAMGQCFNWNFYKLQVTFCHCLITQVDKQSSAHSRWLQKLQTLSTSTCKCFPSIYSIK